MDNANYKITIGDWSVNSKDDARTEVLGVETRSAFNDGAACCEVRLYVTAAPKPDLLHQAGAAAAGALGLGGDPAGGDDAFAITVRGSKIKHGDTVSIELANGDRSATVMTAKVDTVRSTLEQTTIVARTAMHTLATTRLNRTYQNQNVQQIISDLAQQAGVDTADPDTGSTYPYLVVHESRSLLNHICALAQREGLDVYVGTDDCLNAKAFS